MMNRILMAAGFFGALTLGGMASAQTVMTPGGDEPVGKQAGTFMIRGRAIGVIPEDNSSSTTIGGSVGATAQAAPEVDFSYFFTDNIATELIAASTRHAVKAIGTSIGTIDVGSTHVLPPALTLQYHFMPHERFSPYIGAGIDAMFFFDSTPSSPTVQKLSFDNNIGAVIQAGFDYNFSGHWFANFDVKQIFLNTTAHLNTTLGPVTAKTSLDPLVVGAGIGYRF
jgi:outer membrane protein